MALKWKEQPWFEFSRGEYYLKLGERIDFGKCTQYSGGIGSVVRGGVARQNKIELIPYADASGVEPCPGITLETKEAETSTGSGADVGSAGIAREIGLLRLGYVPMVYAAGTTEPYNGMIVAPHPDGCQEWKPGMFILGKFQTEVGTAIDFTDLATRPQDYVFRIKVDVEKSQFGPEAGALDGLTDVVLTGTPDADQVISHNGTYWVNMDIVNENVEIDTGGTETGSLSKAPQRVSQIFGITAGGAAIIPLVAGTPATTQGEYDITGTTITTNATDAIDKVIIQYTTEDLT